MWNSGHFDYSEPPIVFYRDVKGKYLANRAAKFKLFASLTDKEMANLDAHGFAKVHDLVDEEMWSCSSNPFRHMKTLHSAERKAKLFPNWLTHDLKL